MRGPKQYQDDLVQNVLISFLCLLNFGCVVMFMITVLTNQSYIWGVLSPSLQGIQRVEKSLDVTSKSKHSFC